MIFFVPSVKTVQISNANLKYKSQKQISNTNLKCKSQMQVQNANLKCNDQIRRIPGNVGKQEWMGGSEDVQYTIRLGTCLTECLSCPLCRDVSNLKCRTKICITGRDIMEVTNHLLVKYKATITFVQIKESMMSAPFYVSCGAVSFHST